MSRREEVQDLVVEYGALIDEDRLEDWVGLFAEDCRYSVIAAENLAQNLPQTLISCDSKDMLQDRVTAYREVNEYNFHTDRHVIGGVRFRAGGIDGPWRVEASYSLFQTDVEGVTRLFLVGRYEMEVVLEAGRPRLSDVRVIVDTASIPTLLATPV
jgi:anthranilate 1,2-dioxygenase small subunit